MQLAKRTKLEIFVEQHALARIEAMLGESGFTGWSVFEGVEGAGSQGGWRQTGITEGAAYLLVAIGSEAAAESALSWLADYFTVYPGIVAVSEVAVMRGDRF
ncbi:MAG: hypothetical protein K2P58_02985 [Hyphomonadaceae bacterium]|nr:hypothetical protein [Hyphomonadaceae bacterium]